VTIHFKRTRCELEFSWRRQPTRGTSRALRTRTSATRTESAQEGDSGFHTMADMIKSKKDTDASRKRKRESAPVACSSCRKQHLKVRSAFLVVTRLVSRCSRSRRCGVTCAQHSRTFVRSLYGVRRSRASRAPRVVHACSERFVARVRQSARSQRLMLPRRVATTTRQELKLDDS